MRVPPLLLDLNVIELNIQELIDGLEFAGNLKVILELDRYGMVDEGFKKTAPVISRSAFLSAPRPTLQ